jgi:hypothetical protein
MTAIWIVLALFGGVGLGFMLFAALQISREEQERKPPTAVPPVLDFTHLEGIPRV